MVSVTFGDRSYQVRIGRGALLDLARTTIAALSPRMVAIVTDDVVGPLYCARVAESLEASGLRATVVTIPAGESSKTWATAGRILEELASAGLSRSDAVIALGGGVVGDLAGFCAATYLRGVGYIQVPTTLLAQVDSSVGGKTGVDLPEGKNLAGAFWQPAAVLADTVVLESLPDAVRADGVAEIVKTAFLAGDPFLSWLELNVSSVRAGEEAATLRAVETCVGFKADVVAADEREAGGREQLNLGHTLAHAIERVEGFTGVSHGAAVGLGLRFSGWLAERLGMAPGHWRQRQARLLDAASIPEPSADYDPAALLAAMHADKKARGGVVRFVLSPEPGRFEMVPLDDESLLEALALWESERHED